MIKIGWIRIFLVLALVISGLGIGPTQNANALVEEIFPNSSTTDTASARALLAQSGGIYALDAEFLQFKVFIPIADVSSSVISLFAFCEDSSGNWHKGDVGTKSVEVYTSFASEAGGNVRIVNDADPCASSTAHVTTNALGSYGATSPESIVPGHEGYAVYFVNVYMSGSSGGGQSFFVLSDPGNAVTFAEQRDPFTRGVPSFPGRAFATINEQFYTLGSGSNPAEAGFAYDFGPNCDITSPTEAWIKWFDADNGAVNDGGSGVRFVLEDITNGTVNVPLDVFNSAGTQLATGITVVQGNNIGGNGIYREARFTIQPDTDYKWRWAGVDRNNGVQLYMPFSEFNFNNPCPPPTPSNAEPTISATASCTQIRGTARDADGATLVQARIEHNGASTVRSASNVNGSFTISIPASYRSQTSPTIVEWVRVDDVGPSGSGWEYASGFGSTSDNNLNLGTCIAPELWNYIPSATGSPAAGAQLRPGDTVRIDSEVENTGGGTGATYDHQIRVTTGGGNVVNPDQRNFNNQSGISAGGDEDFSNTFTISAGATHGASVCFDSTVSPVSGQSTPSLTITDNGTRNSADVCYTIWNRQFGLDTSVSPPPFAFPGETVNFIVTVENDGPVPAGADDWNVGLNIPVAISGAGGGTVTSGSSTTVTAGTTRGNGPGSVTTQVLVNDSLLPGENVCINVQYDPVTGYSDGDRSEDAGNFDEDFCVVIAERPYFTSQGHDIWAGGVWANGRTCETSNPNGRIQSVLANIGGTNFGAWGEYAAYAVQEIVRYGTRSTPGGTALTFSNDDPTDLGEVLGAGESSPPQCIPDYFGDLYDDSSPQVTDSIDWIGNTAGDEVGYVDRSGSYAEFDSGNDIRSRKTVIIDGDLRIDNDINYGDFTYNSATDAVTGPSLLIVVRGNIYIDQNVRNIDGMLVAQPRADGTGGIIETCASGGAPVLLLSINVCDDQLNVNGALIANFVHMRRTHGGAIRDFQSVNSGGSPLGGAEQYVFHPMLYLHTPLVEPVGGAVGSEFPFLQIKDLPPVF